MVNPCLEFKFSWLIIRGGSRFCAAWSFYNLRSFVVLCFFFQPKNTNYEYKAGHRDLKPQRRWLHRKLGPRLPSQGAFVHKRRRTAVSPCAAARLPFIFASCHHLRIFFFFCFLKAHLRADAHIKAAFMWQVESARALWAGPLLLLHCSDVTYLISGVAGKLSMIMWVVNLTSLWNLDLQP